MTDSTVGDLNPITGAGGLQTADLFYVFRPGTPAADFKAGPGAVTTYVEATATAFAPTVHTHTLASITDAGALAALSTVGTAQITNAAVTYAKIQNVSATDKVLGRMSAGAGAAEEIACTAAGRALIGGADAAAQRTALGLGTLATQGAGAVAITGGAITGLSAPSGGSDAATKSYVDAATAGLNQKASCRVATTAALNTTYSNGSSGVGATLTNAGAKSAIAIDGVTLATGDRVLVKNQATPAQNGIYTATTLGSGSVNWVLTRATDCDEAAEIGEGLYTVIGEGSGNAGTLWLETGAGPFTVGTTSLSFTELAVAPQTVTFTGDVTGTGAGTIALAVGSGKITNTMLAGGITAANLVGTDIATLGTVTAGAWHGSVIAGTYGGTGVNNGANTLTLGGNVTHAGAFATTLTVTGTTSVTLPASGTLLSTAAAVTVGQGGTGLTSGTSGGVPYYSGSSAIASSAALAANAVVVGGGAGAAPASSPVTIDPTTGAIAGFAATFDNQTGTTYTLAAGDTGKILTLNNAAAVTVTLPNSLPAGFTCEVIQLGAGQVTFSAASGATLNNRQSQSKIAGQHGAVRLAVTANGSGTAAAYNLAGDTA